MTGAGWGAVKGPARVTGSLGVAGLGLIGGSLAAGARFRGLADEVLGWDCDDRVLSVAQERGLVHTVTPDLVTLARRADLLVLAVPVGSMAVVAREIAPALRPGTVVTDVGSVKEYIINQLVRLLPQGQPFVPAHPMAGSEHSGPEYADPRLFEGCRYVLCPPNWEGHQDPVEKVADPSLAMVVDLARGLGATPLIMKADEHDHTVAYVSHLPYMVAASLSLAAGTPRDRRELSQRAALASSGFYSTTRVAAGPAPVYRDILTYNAVQLGRAAEEFEEAMNGLRRLVARAGTQDEDQAQREGYLRHLGERLQEARHACRVVVREERPAAGARSASGSVDPEPETDTVMVRSEGPLHGSLAIPGDKSISHRVLMLAGLAAGRTAITNLAPGQDVGSTLTCMRAMGVEVKEQGDSLARELVVQGRGEAGLREPEGVLWAGNSGTTARLLTGILTAQDFFAVLDGDTSLRRRPMRRIVEPLRRMGARLWARRDGTRLPLAVSGRELEGLTYRTPVASAQVKSAILLAGLFATGQTTVVEPAQSRDHTERLLPLFGRKVTVSGRTVTIRSRDTRGRRGAGLKAPADSLHIPGDFSTAAFFIGAALVVPGSRIELRNVNLNPSRTGLLQVLGQMGAAVSVSGLRETAGEPVGDLAVAVPGDRKLIGVDVSGAIIPRMIDELPLLAAVATAARGTTRIRDAEELRHKESDRLSQVALQLRRMGADVVEQPTGLVITGGELHGAEVDSAGDHRLAMTLAVAGLRATGPTTVRNAGAAAVSYPQFFTELARLGAGVARREERGVCAI